MGAAAGSNARTVVRSLPGAATGHFEIPPHLEAPIQIGVIHLDWLGDKCFEEDSHRGNEDTERAAGAREPWRAGSCDPPGLYDNPRTAIIIQ